MTAKEIARYAKLLLEGSLAFRAGDVLVVNYGPAHRDLAVALAEAAYRAGASAVDLDHDDKRVYAARIRHGRERAIGALTPWQRDRRLAQGDERVAVAFIGGDADSAHLAKLDPARVALDTQRTAARGDAARIRNEARLRGTLCLWPTQEWASRAYPELPSEQGLRSLAADLLRFCRIGHGDPEGHRGWTSHLETLRARAETLTRLDLREVELFDRGTKLRVKLGPYSLWRGGGDETKWGRKIAQNTPTEECFISPDAKACEGTFECSRPLVFGGRMIEGLRGEFRGGRLVRLEAKRRADRDWLAAYLASVPNADRLGEIALVDATSRIGRTGRTYFHGLLDENAVAHIAFGNGFAKTRSVPVGKKRYGLNRSSTHIDVMVGTDACRADGITQAGTRIPLIAEGLWRI